MILSSGLHGETYEAADFSRLFEIADTVSLVKIISAEVNKTSPIHCRFKYRVETLQRFKGVVHSDIYQSAPALIDSRYLLIGKISHDCGSGGVSIDLPVVGSLFPILPYNIDWPDEESWVAFGGSPIKFPNEIRLVEGTACSLPIGRSSVDPCPVPLPAANWTDLKKLLKRLTTHPTRSNSAATLTKK